MITVATIALTAFHPGYCFPQMQKGKRVGPDGFSTGKLVSDNEMLDMDARA